MTRIDNAVEKAVKYFRPHGDYVEDHWLSSFHFKLCFGVLLSCSILSGLSSWFSTIECTGVTSDFSAGFAKAFCYANSTLIVVDQTGKPLALGGGNHLSNPATQIRYLHYYQWVTITLVLQAGLFHFPRVIWRFFEGRRLRKYVDSIRAIQFADPESRKEKIRNFAEVFINQRSRNNLFLAYCVCQVLYLVNAIAQFLFIDRFLGGGFVDFVPRYLSGATWVMDLIFPKFTKCFLSDFGSSGDVQKLDALCLLAMNILNEKIYLLLWIMIVVAISVAAVQFSSVVSILLLPKQRCAALLDVPPHRDSPILDSLLNLDLGDWLQLSLIKNNVDVIIFDEVLLEYVRLVDSQDVDKATS